MGPSGTTSLLNIKTLQGPAVGGNPNNGFLRINEFMSTEIVSLVSYKMNH